MSESKKRKRRGPLTLAEHHELLKQEGRYEEMLERQRQRHEEVERISAELERAEEPIRKDLRAVGINVKRVWGLLSVERPYPEAIPILLEHLQKPYPDRVLEAIGRALGVPEAREHWDFLVERFKAAPNDTSAKMGLGDALQLIAKTDKSLLDDVIALVRDPAQGPDRLMLIPVLSQSRDPRAYDTLVEMRDDPDLYKEIGYRLERKKPPPGSRHRS